MRRSHRHSADREPTLAAAAEDWLAAARAGIVGTRSGGPYKPGTLRNYEQNLRLRVLPELGHLRLGELGLPTLQRYVDRLAVEDLAAQTIGLTIAPLRPIYARANRTDARSRTTRRAACCQRREHPVRSGSFGRQAFRSRLVG